MTNAVAVREGGALAMSEPELLQVLGSSLYPGASEASIRMVLGYCKATGLDPMQKPAHIVPMWDSKAKCMRDVVMPGVGLYRIQASRTGEHAGTDEPVFGPMVELVVGDFKMLHPEWCKVTVYRLKDGMKCAYSAIEFWTENYATASKDTLVPNTMWKKRARGQLAKCAEAQALRKAFPEVGSAPAAEEMEGKLMGDEYIDNATGEIAQQHQHEQRSAADDKPAYTDDMVKGWAEKIMAGKVTAANAIARVKTKYTLTEAQEAAIKAMEIKQ